MSYLPTRHVNRINPLALVGPISPS
jgi:hypothetical protein